MAGTCGLCYLTCRQGLGHCCKIKYINMSATNMYEIVTLSRADFASKGNGCHIAEKD